MASGYIVGNEELLNKLSVNQKNNRHWILVYIRKGVGIYLLEDALRSLNEGDLILLPPRIGFSFASDDLGDEYNINLSAAVLMFERSWLNGILNVFPDCSQAVLRVMELKSPLSVSGPKWIKLSSLMSDMLSSGGVASAVSVLRVLDLLSTDEGYEQIREVHGCDTQNVAEKKEKTDRYLECNFCTKISLEDISGYVGMSRTYFSQFFKANYGEGFSDYLTRLRVEKAAVMLLQTDRPLPSVAAECGFKTVQYFTRAFKRVKGVTPGTFRRSGK